jgi:hypothetical protein
LQDTLVARLGAIHRLNRRYERQADHFPRLRSRCRHLQLLPKTRSNAPLTIYSSGVIVRCVQIISPTTGRVVEDHPAVRVGREYLALEILVEHGEGRHRVLLRVLDEQREDLEPYGGHSLWSAEMFETVSDRIPSCWASRLGDGRLTMSPAAWQRSGFWEDFYSTDNTDESAKAWDDYRSALALIKSER